MSDEETRYRSTDKGRLEVAFYASDPVLTAGVAA